MKLDRSVPLCFLVLLVLLAAAPASSFAQAASTAAEALFRAGRASARDGDPATACAKFRESYRFEPALGTLLNIAICEIELGELSEAWRHLQQVVHELPGDDVRLALAQNKLREVEPRLARLTVALKDEAPAKTSVHLGELELGAGSFGVPFPVDPGSYALRVEAPEREPRSYDVQLTEGQKVALEVEPGAPRTPPAPAPPARLPSARSRATPHDTRPVSLGPHTVNAERDARRDFALGLLGLGASSFALGVASGVLVLDRKDIVDEHCDAQKQCDPTGAAAALSGDDFYYAMLATLGVALVSGGLATYLLLAEPEDDNALVAAPAVTRRQVGASLSGRF